MSRLAFFFVIVSALAVAHVSCDKAKHCHDDPDCQDGSKASKCHGWLCLQPCMFNAECASGDCDHDFPNPNGFCTVERGGECKLSFDCPDGHKCDNEYCIPK